ncbi:MAG: 4Fe-4S binding protein [Planctomycetota bacterium]|nr:4Fe-4S binding protein [Planctomycetota bacterium]
MNLLKNGFIYRLLKGRFFILLLRLPFVLAFLFIIFSGLFGSIYRNSADFIVGPVWLTFITLMATLGGKGWCLICPWNTLTEWFQPSKEGQFAIPRIFRNFSLALFLFIVLIYLEYGIGLTDHSRLIAYLSLTIFGLTLICALFFTRKSFCTYICPVGAICGLFGLFSPLELRSNNKAVCQKCQTKDCIRGNQNGIACPVFEYPGTMDNNLYCILCTECIKTCPNDNIALNLRIPGKDLFTSLSLKKSETMIIITMLALSVFGAVNFSYLHFTIINWATLTLSISEPITHLLTMAFLLLSFLAVFYFLSRLGRLPISIIALGFLPVLIFNHLANTLKLFNNRGEEFMSVISDPFGFSWNLFGTAGHLPQPFFTPSQVKIFLTPIILIGLFYSLYFIFRHIREGWRARAISLIVCILIVLLAYFNWWLLVK